MEQTFRQSMKCVTPERWLLLFFFPPGSFLSSLELRVLFAVRIVKPTHLMIIPGFALGCITLTFSKSTVLQVFTPLNKNPLEMLFKLRTPSHWAFYIYISAFRSCASVSLQTRMVVFRWLCVNAYLPTLHYVDRGCHAFNFQTPSVMWRLLMCAGSHRACKCPNPVIIHWLTMHANRGKLV